MTEWSFLDSAQASMEGWGLLTSPTGQLRLRQVGAGPDSDHSVWIRVWKKAHAGSPLHSRALAYLKSNSPDEFRQVQTYVLGGAAR